MGDSRFAPWFKLWYLISSLLAWVSYTYAAKEYLNYITLALLAALVVYGFLACRVDFYAHNIPLAAMFLGYVITLWLNGVAVAETLKSLVWLFISVMVMVLFDKRTSRGEKYRETALVAGTLVVLTLLVSLASLATLLIGQTIVMPSLPEWKMNNGVFENRLYGIVGNPNVLSCMAFISIGLGILLLIIERKRGFRALAWGNIAVQTVVVSATNSRMGIFICCLMLILAAAYFGGRRLRKASIIKRAACLVLAGAVIFGVVNYSAKLLVGFAGWVLGSGDGGVQAPLTLDRSDPYQSDATRTQIYQESLDVFLTSPVFGVGGRNITAAAHEQNPDSALYLKGNTHNSFLHVLAAGGIVAAAMLLWFVGIVIAKFIKYIRKMRGHRGRDFDIVIVCFALMVCLTAVTMTNFALVFANSFLTGVFWWLVGIYLFFVEQALGSPSVTWAWRHKRHD